MPSTAGSEKIRSGGPASSTVLSEFDAEYACSDHAMVRRVVQTAVRNYFAASCISPAHMTLCIDFTEGAPVASNTSPFVRYQAPLVQINMDRKSGPGSTIATTARRSGRPVASPASEKAHQRKTEQRRQRPLLQAAKKLTVSTIQEEEEDMKPLIAVMKMIQTQAPVEEAYHLKCLEKKTATKKVFETLPVQYNRLLSQEKMEEWRKRYEEDKHELYSDQQATTRETSPVTTTRSDTSTSRNDEGMITDEERTTDWGPEAGTIEFEPKDIRGNLNKAIQIRGNLPDIL